MFLRLERPANRPLFCPQCPTAARSLRNVLDRFTSDTFAPLVGHIFRGATAAGDPVDLVLSACEVTRYGSPEGWERVLRRVPYSLQFHARGTLVVPQQIWTVHHPDLGEFALFLVPLGPDERGMRYEAVIS